MGKQRLVMQKAALPLLIGVIALTGCAHHYVMRLNTGSELSTATKPRLKDGAYHFKDARGEEQVVPAFAVRELAPASVAKRENKSQPSGFKSEKKRKWYLLWLG
jgi:hypothetical protein